MAKRCIRCNVNILDDAIKCPLCNGVLEVIPEAGDMQKHQGEARTNAKSKGKSNKLKNSTKNKSDKEAMDDSDEMMEESRSVTYPDISQSLRKMQLIIRIAIFSAIVAEVASIIVNYYTFNGVYWSLIVGVGLMYGCMTLFYSFRDRRSLQRIIQVQLILSIILVIVLDYILGSKNWSFNYAIPLTLVGVDITTVIFMIVGIDDWQSYIMTEIVIFIFSIFFLIMGMCNVFGWSIFTILATLITGLILLGTVMFGQRTISTELKRRFKV